MDENMPAWVNDLEAGEQKEILVEIVYRPDHVEDAFDFLSMMTRYGAEVLSVEAT